MGKATIFDPKKVLLEHFFGVAHVLELGGGVNMRVKHEVMPPLVEQELLVEELP